MTQDNIERLNVASLFDTGGDSLNPTTCINTGTLVESYSRLQLLYGFSRALASESEFSKMPAAALESLERLVNLERCFIATLDEAGQLRPLATHNIELSQDAAEWPVSKTIIKRVLKDGIPILSADTMQDNQFAARQSIHLNRIRTVMCAPLGMKRAPIGLIYADSRRTADMFGHADLLFLLALSHYLYLSILHTEKQLSTDKNKRRIETPPTAVELELQRDHKIIGAARPILQAFERLRRVADRDLPILILGETGVGKELFAHAAHRLSARAEAPFIPLNIAALSETLVESELFGHEKGAFSGASQSRVGKLELANGGTLFLDEVAEIPLNIQVKLLRVLETGDLERVGGGKLIHSNFRLVCATNKSLEEAVKKGQFRDDLYYRIKGVTIQLPSLREHTEDIPALTRCILARINSDKSFTAAALERLQSYHWPGNVRQLIRLIEELDAVCDTGEIDISELPDYLAKKQTTAKEPDHETGFRPLNDLVAQIECEYIQRAIALAGGNNDRAIEMLGISRAKFFDRKKAYGL